MCCTFHCVRFMTKNTNVIMINSRKDFLLDCNNIFSVTFFSDKNIYQIVSNNGKHFPNTHHRSFDLV